MDRSRCRKSHRTDKLCRAVERCGFVTQPKKQGDSPRKHPEFGPSKLIGEVSDQTYDFGKVIADTRTRSHSYTIKNVTDKSFSITKVTNNKTCCGNVGPVAKYDLAPEETVELKVNLKLGHSATVQHLATVETNSEAMPHLEFRTIAEVVPRVWIEEVGGEKKQFKIGEDAAFSFKIVTQSDPSTRPIRLDEESVVGSCRLEWLGPRQDLEQAGANRSER